MHHVSCRYEWVYGTEFPHSSKQVFLAQVSTIPSTHTLSAPKTVAFHFRSQQGTVRKRVVCVRVNLRVCVKVYVT